MDGDRFDDFSRRMAMGVSRRTAVKVAIGGLLVPLGLRRHAGAQVTQVACGNVRCADNPGRCNDGCVCCVYKNAVGQITNSRCRPPGTCAPGITVCPAGEVPDPVRGCAAPRCDGDGDCGARELCCANVCRSVASDPINCGCAGERCPVNETCVAGACNCRGSASAAPRTCCTVESGAISTCSTVTLFTDTVACSSLSSCPSGTQTCIGVGGDPNDPAGRCNACCPAGTTCDPLGFCRQ